LCNYYLSELSFFKDYPKHSFTFIAVTDINMRDYPHCFKAVFRNLHTGQDVYVDNIYPESIRQKYLVGYMYKREGLIGISPNVKSNLFKVNNDPYSPLIQLFNVFNHQDNILIKDEQAYKDFLRQYAHIEIYDDCMLIIPCYTIAITFYLLYGSMKKAAMIGKFENLYVNDTLRYERLKDGTVRAHLKFRELVGKKNIAHVVRLADNKYGQNRFNYIMQSKKSSTPFHPIRAKFPIATAFTANISYIETGKDERGMAKYLVLNIISNDIPFDFHEVSYTL